MYLLTEGRLYVRVSRLNHKASLFSMEDCMNLTLEEGRKTGLVLELGSVNSRAEILTDSNEALIRGVLKDCKAIHHNSRECVAYVEGQADPGNFSSLFFTTAHQAFDEHVPLSISPELFWYAIVHELSIYVKANKELAANIFGADPDEKKEIIVRDDSLVYGGNNDWAGSIALVEKPLIEVFKPNAIELFVPNFTTLTPEIKATFLVGLMDTVSEYVELKWVTRCGIPRIKLEGKKEDWQLLAHQAKLAHRLFLGLDGYFRELIPVLERVAETFDGSEIDRNFWTSFYKIDDGSGGPFASGWLTSLLCYLNTEKGPTQKKEFDWRKDMDAGWSGLTTDEYPTHISKVNFLWEYLDAEIPMGFAAGVTGVEWSDGFLSPKLGYVVYERNAK